MTHRIAIIVSEFNHEITDKLLEGAKQHLNIKNISANDVYIVKVPGAIEIPLTAKLLAANQDFAAIICLGAVIRGETSHYDYVCQQVSHGCQQVMLEFLVPVIFGVLTTENEEQALDRVGGKFGHKGVDAAEAALRMIAVVENIHQLTPSYRELT